MKQLVTVFVTVLLAEIGDKTRVATMLFATDQSIGRVGVFIAASAALIAGGFISQ